MRCTEKSMRCIPKAILTVRAAGFLGTRVYVTLVRRLVLHALVYGMIHRPLPYRGSTYRPEAVSVCKSVLL